MCSSVQVYLIDLRRRGLNGWQSSAKLGIFSLIYWAEPRKERNFLSVLGGRRESIAEVLDSSGEIPVYGVSMEFLAEQKNLLVI